MLYNCFTIIVLLVKILSLTPIAPHRVAEIDTAKQHSITKQDANEFINGKPVRYGSLIGMLTYNHLNLMNLHVSVSLFCFLRAKK